MTEFATSADGTRIGFHVHGDGPVLLLVDGAMCSRAGGPMPAIAEAIGDTRRVVVYDRRGRGESGDTAPYAVEREIEDVAAIGAAVGGPLALFGISSGGALALRAAGALSIVTRVAVYEPPFMPEPALAGARTYTAELARALRHGDRGAAVEAFLRRVGVAPDAVVGVRRSPAWPGMEALAPTLAYDDAVMGDSRVPDLTSLRADVLALAGGASPDFLHYGAQTVAARSGGRFEVLAHQTHDITPAAAAEALADFLD
ncbi:alpha/beta fold hydrolase [Naasia lichenicola]|uniref:Alpha/beta fold hydrolase n=1 Tax=Naasia lichenicola TaxID=2565933 RepID=A0A4S4FLG5_9MICO|nr:alpha/beta fold hydrolase [Naasia lichenicola]THG30056.1 alpha/beta fold hydrolase [Naasia lichenicola]